MVALEDFDAVNIEKRLTLGTKTPMTESSTHLTLMACLWVPEGYQSPRESIWYWRASTLVPARWKETGSSLVHNPIRQG